MLTRRVRPAAQGRVLTRWGIPFHVHPVDGVVVVARDAVATKLGALPKGNLETPMEYDVDIRSIRQHGKTTPSR